MPSRRSPSRSWVVQLCRGCAERDLARVRGRLGLDADRGIGTREHELAVDPADEEAVERAAVDADRHPQADRPGSGRAPAHGGQGLLHPDRCRAGALGMVRAAEQQQDGVSAELQEVGMVGVGRPDQLAERGIDDAGDLLGALPSALRERLGQLGEPRDVGEDERPLEAARARLGRLAQPVDRDARHERPQRVGRRLEARQRRVAHGRGSLGGHRVRCATSAFTTCRVEMTTESRLRNSFPCSTGSLTASASIVA